MPQGSATDTEEVIKRPQASEINFLWEKLAIRKPIINKMMKLKYYKFLNIDEIERYPTYKQRKTQQYKKVFILVLSERGAVGPVITVGDTSKYA